MLVKWEGAGHNASWQPPINIRENKGESTPLRWLDNRPEVDRNGDFARAGLDRGAGYSDEGLRTANSGLTSGCNFAKNRSQFESAIPGEAQGLVGPACVVRQRRALGLSFIA
jgi:hypothetical protein